MNIVTETFGGHPSDQCRAFYYFIKHTYDVFHHLVIHNLQWWEENGSVFAIEESLGAVLKVDMMASLTITACARNVKMVNY